MPDPASILVYGAYGYTGDLVLRRVERYLDTRSEKKSE